MVISAVADCSLEGARKCVLVSLDLVNDRHIYLDIKFYEVNSAGGRVFIVDYEDGKTEIRRTHTRDDHILPFCVSFAMHAIDCASDVINVQANFYDPALLDEEDDDA